MGPVVVNGHGWVTRNVIDWTADEGSWPYPVGSRHGRLQVNLCACPTGWCTREADGGGDGLCGVCRKDARCTLLA